MLKEGMMKKYIMSLLVFFLANGFLLAQEMSNEQGGHHAMPFNKPNAFAANMIIWCSVAVVVFTLVLTLKYLFKPEEDNPNHIKNIVTDDGF